MYVLKKGAQVQRVVKVVGQQFQVEYLLFNTPGSRLEKSSNDGAEHVFAQRAVGSLALAHQFSLNAIVVFPDFPSILEPCKQTGKYGAEQRKGHEFDPTRQPFFTHVICFSVCTCRQSSRVRSHNEWAGRTRTPPFPRFELCISG